MVGGRDADGAYIASVTANPEDMRSRPNLGSSKKPRHSRSREVAAAKMKLDDPRLRPVVRLINLLGGLRERYPENFRKIMETLSEGLTGKLIVELRDGRKFASIGPFAVPHDVINDKE